MLSNNLGIEGRIMKEHEKNLEVITRTYGLEKLGNGPDDVVQVETLKNQRLTILTGYMHVSDMRSKKTDTDKSRNPSKDAQTQQLTLCAEEILSPDLILDCQDVVNEQGDLETFDEEIIRVNLHRD